MDIQLVLLAAAALACSGLPSFCFGRRSTAGQRISAGLMVLGGSLGLCGTIAGFMAPRFSGISLPWLLPWGRFAVALDGISAVFLAPVFLVPALGAIYGLRYWRHVEHPDSGRKVAFFYGLLAGAMVLVVTARDGILFLVAWEVMALSAFFLVTTEDEDSDVCRAGWIYLVATHAGTLCLVAMFGLLQRATGSYALGGPLPEDLSPGLAGAIFVLAVAGFGMKAGIMPLHVWLPGAHANAPTHVSAVLSGVMIKMGVYGIVRIVGLFSHPHIGWGGVILVLGAVSALLGVVFAIAQHDLKRLLAYHSIENIGIILMGVGLAMLGRSLDRPDWILLGLAGALLHVWNHGLFKSLLFFSAGSVIHAAGTRQIDRLGGLAKRMPWTSLGFLIGAVAICGLPPLNGFVSEWLLYLGLFSTVASDGNTSCMAAALAVPLLAMVGALAVACFVKVFGVVFLGEARSESAARAHESPKAMLGPLTLLAACCFAIGLAPWAAVPALERAVADWMPPPSEPAMAMPRLAALAPLGAIGTMALVLLGLLAFGIVVLRRHMRRGLADTLGTWDCGYVRPTPRMQYTASSFAGILVDMFSWALRTRTHRPHVDGLFPRHSRFHSHTEDTVLDGATLPLFRSAAAVLLRFRMLVHSRSQIHILYILLILVTLLVAGQAFQPAGVSQAVQPDIPAHNSSQPRPAARDTDAKDGRLESLSQGATR